MTLGHRSNHWIVRQYRRNLLQAQHHAPSLRLAWRLWPLAVALLLIGGGLPRSQAASPYAATAVAQGRAATAADPPRIFADYVTDYSATGLNNLSHTDEDAKGLLDKLKNCSDSRRRSVGSVFGNSAAFETDWKAQSLGGQEHIWVDTADLAYFSGHGDPNGIYFGTLHDNRYLRYTEASNAWGNDEVEWIAFSACETLSANTPLSRWAGTMNGLHLLLGFRTLMADVAYGTTFGSKLCFGNSLTQAWFGAADVQLPSYQTPRVLAEEEYQFNDRIEDRGPNDPNDSDYFTRSYTRNSNLTSLMPQGVQPEAARESMPLLLTPQLSQAEAHAQLDKLGQVFNVDVRRGFVQPATAPAQDNIFQSTDGKFTFDLANGLFVYHNTDRLWATPAQAQTVAGAAQPAMIQVSQTDAKALADQFLRDHALMPADARFHEVVVEQIESWERATDPNQLDKRVAVKDVGYKVIYSRVVTPPTTGAAGNVQATEEFPVVGPGPKLLVYVDATAPAGATRSEQAQSAVTGMVGGYRRVASSSLQATAAEVPILSQQQIEALFNTLESTVALAFTPAVYESRHIRNVALSYYERPLGRAQDQLIPVYTLDVAYTGVDNTTSEGLAYIPANPAYMAPLAQITAPIPAGGSVAPGTALVLQASDASAKLADLGFDPALNFALGSGQPEAYTYTWYRNDVAPQNKLGEGRTLSYTPAAANGEKPDAIEPQTIVLEVRDTQATHGTNVSTTSFQFNAQARVYLPLINR